MSTGKAGNWHNWSSSVKSSPREVVKPASLQELAGLLARYAREGRHVRVVGAGHSLTPLVQTDDILMSLDNMQGIESVDAEHGHVAIWGGTKLHKLGNALLERGLAQENLGDIDVQSIAGAISRNATVSSKHISRSGQNDVNRSRSPCTITYRLSSETYFSSPLSHLIHDHAHCTVRIVA